MMFYHHTKGARHSIPGDTSVSDHQTFFSPKDSINVARKKWYDVLGQDYEFFWDVYTHMIDIDTLSIIMILLN